MISASPHLLYGPWYRVFCIKALTLVACVEDGSAGYWVGHAGQTGPSGGLSG